MLYAIAHFLRDKMPWLWDVIDIINSWLFTLRYGRKLDSVENGFDKSEVALNGFEVKRMREVPTEKLVEFFARQPKEAFKFFKPHGFDATSIKKLQRNKAFLGYVVVMNSNEQSGMEMNGTTQHQSTPLNSTQHLSTPIITPQHQSTPLNTSLNNDFVIAGYCFNRSFFHGKGFRGRMVDINYRGKGLGTMMNKLLNEVGFGIGLRLFETVSKDNVASYRSALSASNVKVLEEMEDNELFLEILPE